MRKALVVEDDHSLCDLIAVSLRREGLDVDCTDNADEAIGRIQEGAYEIVVLDLVLRESSGFYVVNAIRKMAAERRPRVIVITGTSTDAMKSIDRSIVKAVMFKPLDLSTFAPFVRIEADRLAATRPK
jgi:DNA-binding response OmpR family regulator